MIFACLPVILTKVDFCLDSYRYGISRFSTIEILAKGTTLKLFYFLEYGIAVNGPRRGGKRDEFGLEQD
jgi:hypothetical protein